jgi:hypothetical protein
MVLTRLQILGAPDNATRLAFTPKNRELVFQEDTLELYVGDGSTAGGILLATGLSAVVTGGANVGVGGVGVFKQLTGATLEFRSVIAGSTRVTVVLNGSNNEIEIDIDPAQILTSQLNNDAGFLNEASHDALPSDNPHGVTATQVGLGNVPNVDATQRANHTGTQLANTISDFEDAVKNLYDKTIQQDNSEQVTTSTTPVDRFNFNKNPLHTDNYEISVDYTWAYDDGGTDFICELLVGGVVVREHQQEPKDVGGSDGGAGTNQRMMANMKYIFAATQGVPFGVQLRFQAESGGVEATIRDSVVVVKRALEV